MPTIEVDTALLARLVGVELGAERLEELLFNFKGEVEGWGERSVSVELASDRPDLLSASGLARAFRGFLALEEGLPRYMEGLGGAPGGGVGAPTLRVEGWVAARPYVDSYYVWGLSLDDASVRDIIALQERLHASLSRGRSRFAIGVHDASRLGSLKLVYRGMRPEDIRFTPLGEQRQMGGGEILEATEKGREYAHLLAGASEYPVFSTEAGEILSMPPIINSSLTRVDASTRSVVVDVTGLDQGVVEAVAQLVAANIAEYGEGAVHTRVEAERWKPVARFTRKMKLNLEEVNGLLGLELGAEEASRLLGKARLDAHVLGHSSVEVDVPLYRVDLLHPVDLAEDVAMMYGYNRVEPELPKHFTVGRYHPMSLVTRAARNSLSTLGFVEVNNLALTSTKTLSQLGFSGVVALQNPWSEDLDALRPTLVAGLLAYVARNQNKPKPLRIFEVGQVGSAERGVYTQTLKAAAAICDNVASADVVESYVNRFADDLGLRPAYGECGLSFLLKGRRASVSLSGVEVGFVGEVSPETLRALAIDYPVALFELTLYTPRFEGLTFK